MGIENELENKFGFLKDNAGVIVNDELAEFIRKREADKDSKYVDLHMDRQKCIFELESEVERLKESIFGIANGEEYPECTVGGLNYKNCIDCALAKLANKKDTLSAMLDEIEAEGYYWRFSKVALAVREVGYLLKVIDLKDPDKSIDLTGKTKLEAVKLAIEKIKEEK